MKRSLLHSLALLALSPLVVQAQAAPPLVVGERQLLAPGTRPAPHLPTLTLTPAIPEVRRVETLSNGFITGAHALVLVPGAEVSPSRLRALALQVVRSVYVAKPDLAEVDVSLYRAETYGGFGGPLPLMTLSVPAARRGNVAQEWAAGRYDRVWQGDLQGAAPSAAGQWLADLEEAPVFVGSEAQLWRAQLEQALGLARGGTRGSSIYRGAPTDRALALTYDDAPHPLYLPLVLDALRRGGAHATFFIIGRNAEAYPYFVRDIAAQGHEVGNHTYHHVRLPHLSDAEILSEIKSTNDLLTRLTGRPVRYFRPPGGEYSPRVLQLAQTQGLKTVFWTDDPGDFQNPGVLAVEERYARYLRPGGIILLHDNAPDSLLALPTLLRLAAEQGYTLEPVGTLDK